MNIEQKNNNKIFKAGALISTHRSGTLRRTGKSN
jgi:hypothetical protein